MEFLEDPDPLMMNTEFEQPPEEVPHADSRLQSR